MRGRRVGPGVAGQGNPLLAAEGRWARRGKLSGVGWLGACTSNCTKCMRAYAHACTQERAARRLPTLPAVAKLQKADGRGPDRARREAPVRAHCLPGGGAHPPRGAHHRLVSGGCRAPGGLRRLLVPCRVPKPAWAGASGRGVTMVLGGHSPVLCPLRRRQGVQGGGGRGRVGLYCAMNGPLLEGWGGGGRVAAVARAGLRMQCLCALRTLP